MEARIQDLRNALASLKPLTQDDPFKVGIVVVLDNMLDLMEAQGTPQPSIQTASPKGDMRFVFDM